MEDEPEQEEEYEPEQRDKKQELTEELAAQYFEYIFKELAAIKHYLRLDSYSA